MAKRTVQSARPPACRLPPTPPMLKALAALAEGQLVHFRVGYGRDARGPFFPHGTIEGLWKRNLCDLLDRHRARRRVAISPLGRVLLSQGEAA